MVDRMRDVKVDGQFILEVVNTQRTPNHMDPRPEGKFGEAFAAAYAACAIGLVNIELSTSHDGGSPRERPDLLLRASGDLVVGVEVVIADETSAARVRLMEVQERIVRVFERTPQLAYGRVPHFTVSHDELAKLSGSAVRQLGDEFEAFLESGIMRLLPSGHLCNVFPEGSLARQCKAIIEFDRPTYAAVIAFARCAPIEPYQAILNAIEKKRAAGYEAAEPMWLVVDVRDPRGPFAEALEAVKAHGPRIDPFERVIIQDGFSHIELP